MARAAERDARMGVPEFLAWAERRPDGERWELLDGAPVLMAPPSARHQRIVTNLLRRLDALAERVGCGAYPGLAISIAAADHYAPFPDVVVHCGPTPPTGTIDDPLIVVEVLSPSSLLDDRGRKATFYRAVPSLRSLLIVHQDEARVELYRRDAAWTARVAGPGAALDLPEIGGTLAVADVYARIAF